MLIRGRLHFSFDLQNITSVKGYLSKEMMKRALLKIKQNSFLICTRNRYIRPEDTVKPQVNNAEYFAVTYSAHGDPEKVLEGVHQNLPPLGSFDVQLKMLAAPINPVDINMIQGVYPIKPNLPAVGGNEGVGEVVDVGAEVTAFKHGDWVVPKISGWGTWRTGTVCCESDLIGVANDIPATTAATLSVNPCTAFRMLHDFVKLEPGDVVIQNGANSGVGQAVIQLARHMKVQTINIVRTRPDIVKLEDQLKQLGATYVLTDSFVKSKDMKQFMSRIPKAKLALNCVGGKSVADLLKNTAPNGTLVTFGGMSKQPLMVPAGPLIFNNIKLKGYWMTQWNKENANSKAQQEMWDFLCQMVRKKKLKSQPIRKVPIQDFQDGITKAMEPFVTEKQVLVMK